MSLSLDTEAGFADAPVLVAGAAGAVWLDPSGEIEEIARDDARRRWERGPAPLVCHAAAMRRRVEARGAPALDVLELWAFVRPAAFCVPTPRGLAQALGLDDPRDLADQAMTLRRAAGALLDELAAHAGACRDAAARVAVAMARGGWPWSGDVLDALDAGPEAHGSLDVWTGIEAWSDLAPRAPAGHDPVSEAEARERLARLLGDGAEARPQQAEYAARLTPAFRARERAGEPHAVIAEAGTGVGKTLGYIAPASVWAEKNEGTVWISTFTRNLQRQVDQELARLFPDPAVKGRRIVLRKGRENYLCLLNLVEAANVATSRLTDAVPLGLVARWAAATGDGDIAGGDFPAWLVDLFGPSRTVALADRRGECVYSACPHYEKCFVERSVRKARGADLVVANHALVLVRAVLASDEGELPTRYVFDEGHHLFDAADSAFSDHITGREGSELRRWLLGPEGRRSRARGLQRRVGDLVEEDGRAPLDAALKAARCLPADGWLRRVADGAPRGPGERFLALVRQQVLARAVDAGAGYGLECEVRPPVEGLPEAALALEQALHGLERPLVALAASLALLLDTRAAELDTPTRIRIEAMVRGIARRGVNVCRAWRRMLDALRGDPPDDVVDWLSLDRIDGREIDVGMHRHRVDPGLPFAEIVARHAHGLAVTSATLRDAGDENDGWAMARLRTGLRHLAVPPAEVAVASPFDYPALTRVLVVTDVAKRDAAQVAAAFRELFFAAGGGALGLFTAIARLREVHRRIAEAMEHAGLALYAQHVDAMDTGTLVDIFRAEEDACLLGTDAVRDGVDVPGRSLRLIVFDRVPWPRPDILHKARREAFGGNRWDDMLTRLRLRQAFGRLVRRADDRGVFVMLDPALPSRLATAFPQGVAVERVGLAAAVAAVQEHLAGDAAPDVDRVSV